MNDKQREHLHKCAEVLASGYFGSFAAAIGDAMQRADADNLAKLRRAFPDLIQRAGEKLAHDQTRDLFETLGA